MKRKHCNLPKSGSVESPLWIEVETFLCWFQSGVFERIDRGHENIYGKDQFDRWYFAKVY